MKQQAADAEASRLSMIRTYGLAAIPWDAPSSWRAKVSADLDRFVTAAEFPPRLSFPNCSEIIQAHVKQFLAPWFREQEKEEAQKEAQRRKDALKAQGRSHAHQETSDWDWSAQTDARREVQTALDQEVQADWLEMDVRELVDDILDQWDDEEE